MSRTTTTTPSCSFCGEPAEEALSIRHRECGHLTHADCLDTSKKPNYKKCGACTGENVSLSAIASLSPISSSLQEPRTIDGIDYVLRPGLKRNANALMRVAAYVPGLGSRVAENVENSTNPEFLLNNKVPVTTIMKRNKLGLDHFLRAGVTLEDFLKNGYTWKDLVQFEDISGRKGPKRALQALCVGLQGNATHFRDYPDAFPYAQVKAHTKCDTKDLEQYFGLTFPPDGPLECMGDQNWSARDCLALGLRMDDLCDLGLMYVEQFQDLLEGLSRHELDSIDAKLGATEAHFKALQSAEVVVPVRAAEAAAPVRAIRAQQPMATHIQAHEQQQQEEEVAMLVQECFDQAVPIQRAAATASRIRATPAVNAPARQLISHVPPKPRHHRAGGGGDGSSTNNVASEATSAPVPTHYTRRAQTRSQMHGLRIQ
jgi:hypothetical protein